MDSTTVQQKFNVSDEVIVVLRSGDVCAGKIVEIRRIEKVMHYRVHYPKLGKDSDEWIPFESADELIFKKDDKRKVVDLNVSL